jgi:starch phosphorylase
MAGVENNLRAVGDAELWQLRADGRKALIDYVRKTQARQLAGQGASAEKLLQSAQVLETDTLTLGFARRFATYKRPNLLLHDPQRLVNILSNKGRPVQIVLAGKAHPQDLAGQNMIREWFEFSSRPEVRSRVVFLSDYDALMAEHLVQGVDVWVNTPRRPWEASGTSGMKVLVNGGLNLSELDGWWAEAYSPEVGWAIGDRQEHGDELSWDAVEADALYGLLEREVVPEFYNRDEHGIPRRWVARMRESMARLTPTFSTNRVVRQYTEEHYLPAATAVGERAAQGGLLGADLLKWRHELEKHWTHLRFGPATVEQDGQLYFFQVQVFLDDLSPEGIRVELYAEARNGETMVRQLLRQGERLIGSVNGFMYTARIPTTRPATDFTPRVVPYHDRGFVPLEAPFILWHDSPSWR